MLSAWDGLRRKWFVFGGFDWLNNHLSADFAVFDAERSTWSALPSGPPARAYGSAVWDNASQRLIVFGGVGSVTPRSDTWVFDPATEAWLEVSGPGPGARVGGAFFQGISPPIHFGGAEHITPGAMAFNDLWQLDVGSERWTRLEVDGGRPVARRDAIAVGLGSTGFVLGGHAEIAVGIATYDDTWAYDITRGAWRQVRLDSPGGGLGLSAGVAAAVRGRP
jgi:N-acetylneuraminic acid mutarotase